MFAIVTGTSGKATKLPFLNVHTVHVDISMHTRLQKYAHWSYGFKGVKNITSVTA